ncbi:MAG TPA: hypothetical protein VFQ48_03750 [Pseudonocardiaceae bacterium]|nr:hypothetical protein [Pseudonocardiaceae bacterium]
MRVHVARFDGSTAVFAAQRVQRHGKNAFPTEAIYGDAPGSQLRLIRCGEGFDDTSRRYPDNIIVYALRAG